MFIRNVAPLIVMSIFIAGAFYAGNFFKEIHSRSNGAAYFMIPATQLEKLIVGIVITTVYYFIMMIISYVIGNLAGTFLNNMLASVNIFGWNIFHYIPLQWKLFSDASGVVVMMNQQAAHNLMGISATFFISQSLFLLGSIYFKSNQTFKTILSVIVIQILLIIPLIIAVRLIFGDSGINPGTLQNPNDFGMIAVEILRPFKYLLPPFFWVVSYFRLTEKQV
jgi:hypothetical protein